MSQKKFKWNTVERNITFWDASGDVAMFHQNRSDKELMNGPAGAKTDDLLHAIARVLSELIELTEAEKLRELETKLGKLLYKDD